MQRGSFLEEKIIIEIMWYICLYVAAYQDYGQVKFDPLHEKAMQLQRQTPRVKKFCVTGDFRVRFTRYYAIILNFIYFVFPLFLLICITICLMNIFVPPDLYLISICSQLFSSVCLSVCLSVYLSLLLFYVCLSFFLSFFLSFLKLAVFFLFFWLSVFSVS